MSSQTAVLAGATGALGQAIARALSLKGFQVWCGYNESEGKAESLAAELGGRAVRLSSLADPVQALEKISENNNPIGLLINASGINIEGHALSFEPDDWQKVHEVNFNWALRLTQAALRIMLPQGGGRIIHLSSSAARFGGRGQLNYAVSKAALERLVRGLALEVGPKGILINAVAPGVIRSPMAQRVIDRYGDKLLERIASRRFGRPEEVAQVVAFLAGPEATYINGAVLPVDGGLW
ncbi:MAG: SDR family oxidoreductase [Deltaproteobacteria bacterium]|jgi:3-oxoacyl-[acyl-carrier protein] reductase|nr:SDR family oxidoreductase [Deltaproteobacteria bacterium]